MNNTFFTSGLFSSFLSKNSNDAISFPNNAERANSPDDLIRELKDIIMEQSVAIKVLNREMSKLIAKTGELEKNNKSNTTIETPKVTISPTHKITDKGNSANNKELKILIYGITKLTQQEIFDTIQNKLQVGYNIHVKKSDIEIITEHDTDKLKNISPVDKLKSDKYDYLIVGPHPHSVKGKNLKHNWATFLKNRNIKTEAFEGYRKPVSKEDIVNIADKIGRDNFRPQLPDQTALSNVG